MERYNQYQHANRFYRFFKERQVMCPICCRLLYAVTAIKKLKKRKIFTSFLPEKYLDCVSLQLAWEVGNKKVIFKREI